MLHTRAKGFKVGMRFLCPMKFEKILLTGGLVLAAWLALKSIKQFIYLSFTLLSLKIVWILIVVLFLLNSVKKATRSSNETKK